QKYASTWISGLAGYSRFFVANRSKPDRRIQEKEELLGWKRLAGRWLSLFDWGGTGMAPLRAGLRFAAAPLRRSGVLGWKGRPVSARVVGMSMDTELQKHYALLLGVGSPWEV